MNKTSVFAPLTAVAALVLSLNVSAQTTPNSPATSPDRGTMDSPPPRMNDRATDTPTQENSAWQRFDDRTNTDLGLDVTQRERLREVDMRYDKEYQALGDDAVNNPDYDALRERRDVEIRGILTEDQYERWNATGTEPAVTPEK